LRRLATKLLLPAAAAAAARLAVAQQRLLEAQGRRVKNNGC
jgi:hypothetical protein